jgi:hypothetical protein
MILGVFNRFPALSVKTLSQQRSLRHFLITKGHSMYHP